MAKPIEISSKYPWNPPHRPPPADPSIAMRVAMMSPLAKCLESALEELREEDHHDSHAPHTAQEDEGDSNHHHHHHHHHHRRTSDISSKSNNGKLQQEDDLDSESPLSTSPRTTRRDDHDNNNKVSFDRAMSKSIIEAYCKAVVETKFDGETNHSYTATTSPSTLHTTTAIKGEEAGAKVAPAAMLMGEIDHYNRVGGQWRIVVKNAYLKRRSTTVIDNGKTGRSFRRRMMLDWNDAGVDVDDDDNDNSACHAIHGTRGVPDHNSTKVYRFPGTIQILAYDDAT